MAATFDSPTVAFNLHVDVTNAATANYDVIATRGLRIVDAWILVVDAISGAGANTAQIQTIGGAATVTDAMGFNAQARGTLVRAGTILSANNVFATGETIRYRVVGAVAPNSVAFNAVCVPA